MAPRTKVDTKQYDLAKIEQNDGEQQSEDRIAKLLTSERVNLIKKHREYLASIASSACRASLSVKAPDLKLQEAASLAPRMQPIYVKDMDSETDKVYKQRYLEAIIVDEAICSTVAINILVEDPHGDLQRMSIYGLPRESEETWEKIGYGNRIILQNPYHRIALDGRSTLRVDDITSLHFLGPRRSNLCRLCRRPAETRCGRCGKAYYCCRDCQVADWTLVGHKIICDLLKQSHSSVPVEAKIGGATVVTGGQWCAP